jgi:hypothetical protein
MMYKLRCIAGTGKGGTVDETFYDKMDDEHSVGCAHQRSCMEPSIGLFHAFKQKSNKKATAWQEQLALRSLRQPDSRSPPSAKQECATTKQECAPTIPPNQTVMKRGTQPPQHIEFAKQKDSHYRQGSIQSRIPRVGPTRNNNKAHNAASREFNTKNTPTDAKQILKDLFLIEEDRMIEKHLAELASSFAEPVATTFGKDTAVNSTSEPKVENDGKPKLEYTPIARDKLYFPPSMNGKGEKVAFSHDIGMQVIRSLDTQDSVSSEEKDESTVSSLSNDIQESIDKIKECLIYDGSEASDESFEIHDEAFDKRHEMSTRESISKVKHHLGHDFNQEVNDSFEEAKALIVPDYSRTFWTCHGPLSMGEIDVGEASDQELTNARGKRSTPQTSHLLKFDDSSLDSSFDYSRGYEV